MKFASVLVLATAATSVIAAPTPKPAGGSWKGAALNGAVGGATMGGMFAGIEYWRKKHDEKKQVQGRSLIRTAINGAVGGFGAGAGFAAFNALKGHHDKKEAEEEAEKAKKNGH